MISNAAQMVTTSAKTVEPKTWRHYIDYELVITLMALLGIGIVMLASASFWVAEKEYQNPYYYLQRQFIFLGLGLLFSFIIYQIRIDFWQNLGVKLLPIIWVLLILVLIPGIGVEVNGSRRWLNIGFTRLQISEISKLIMLLYLSGYLIRHGKHLATSPSYKPLAIPLLVMGMTGFLLMLEPDFGSTMVICITGMALLFLGGVPLKRLGILLGGAAIILTPLAFIGYRGRRLLAYWDPLAIGDDGSFVGYQTVNAQMAIGDGGWFGAGLGGGMQKLLYLPEAHNDFIFSVLAEEFGFVGMVVVLVLFGWLVRRAFIIGFHADKNGQHFGAYVAYGVGFWVGLQVIMHIGVNLALLPPKGLTLPLISYGGSSLMITLMAIALVMRVYRETRIPNSGTSDKNKLATARVTVRKAQTVRKTTRDK